MLDGIVTGYEEKFDFPQRDVMPERPWLFASVPRSGSTFVSHLLWATGCLGAPLEYLNFDPAGPYGFANEEPARQREIWRSAVRHRTSPNGVFGLKAFPDQLEALQVRNPNLMAEVMRALVPSRSEARVVELRRRDRTAHAISYARAILSGIWRHEQESEHRVEPDYAQAAVESAARLIERQEGAWQAMYRGLRIEPLVIWYEDAVADQDGMIAAVAAHLGVSIDPAAAITVPRIERQSQFGARTWAERHASR